MTNVVVGWILGLFSKPFADRIAAWLFGPQLTVAIETNPPVFSQNNGPNEMYVRIAVENCGLDQGIASAWEHSAFRGLASRIAPYVEPLLGRIRKPRTAENCRAWLVNIEEQAGADFKSTNFRDSFPLIWSFDAIAEGIVIPRGVRRHVDIVTIKSGAEGFTPRLRGTDGKVLSPSQYTTIFQKYGTFRFTAIVSADELSPVQIKVVVEWNGKWPPTISKSE